ncbi:MAG: hypothetical protein Q9221_003484 [Calogaya cf. arnoldii]
MAIYVQWVLFVYIVGVSMGIVRVHGDSSKEYIIWPRPIISAQDFESIESLLKSLVVDPTSMYTSRSTLRPDPAFWLADLNNDSYQKVSRHPKVEDIGPNEIEDLCASENLSPTEAKVSLNRSMPMSRPLKLGDTERVIDRMTPSPN